MRVLAFVGPSGTGKSYRAQMVAGENNIEYIIDDGLLIKDNTIASGTSAKKAPTKIETVRRALFINQTQQREMRKAIKELEPDSILILGTSNKMVAEIASNLGLPEIEKIIYIDEVATKKEMEAAKRERTTGGKHVIPVPSFEVKPSFSGFILDPLQVFNTSHFKNNKVEEKSIVRPTFSYFGNFTISDKVFRQIIEYRVKDHKNITELLAVRLSKSSAGPSFRVDVEIKYGVNIFKELESFKKDCTDEIEELTTMNVRNFEITAKRIKLPNNMSMDLEG